MISPEAIIRSTRGWDPSRPRDIGMSRGGLSGQTGVATGENVGIVSSTGETESHVSRDRSLPARTDDRRSDISTGPSAFVSADGTAFPRRGAVRDGNVPIDGVTRERRTRVPVPSCRNRRLFPAADTSTEAAESTPLDAAGDGNANLGERRAFCGRVASDALQSDTPSSEPGSKTNENTRNPYDDK